MKPTIIHCTKPACTFAASALGEGRALNALASHLVASHLPTPESIASAKAAMYRERAAVERACGIVIRDTGHLERGARR